MTWFTVLKMPGGIPRNRGPLGGKKLEGWFTPEELEAKKGIWPIGDEREVYLVFATARNRMSQRYGKHTSEKFQQMHGKDNWRIEYNKELKKHLITELAHRYENKPKGKVRRHGGRNLPSTSGGYVQGEEWEAKYGNYDRGGWNKRPPKKHRVEIWEADENHKRRIHDMDRKNRLDDKNLDEKIRDWKRTISSVKRE